MHIEPGLVDERKIWLSYVTAAGAGAYTLKLAWDAVEGAGRRVARSPAAPCTTALVFSLLRGAAALSGRRLRGAPDPRLDAVPAVRRAPAAIGLALGLLIQGLFFAPFDLPQ